VERLIAYRLETGETVGVEVDEPDVDGVVRAGRPDEIAETASKTFESALADLRPATDHLVTQLRQIAQKPDQIQIEFGIKLTAAAGAVFAKAGGEANFKVTLTWTGSD